MKAKKLLKLYNIFIAIFQIIVILLLFTAVYPLAIQEIKVEEIGEPDISFDGNSIILKVPVKIINGGLYDIDDITLSYIFTNSSSEFLKGSQYLGRIESGEDAVIPLIVNMDLKKIYEMESPDFYHFFHQDTLKANFTLSLKYLLDMVYFTAEYNTTLTWNPPIRGYSMGENYKFFMNSTGLYLTIPFTLDTASYLWGDANIMGDVFASKNKIGMMNTSLPLGKVYDGKIYLHFFTLDNLLNKSQKLELRGNFYLLNFSFPINFEYNWGAPLANFSYFIRNNSLFYSFTDESPQNLDLLINVTYYKANTIIGKDTKRLYVASGNFLKEQIYFPSENFDKIVLTLYDTISHISYQEVIEL